MMGRKTELSQVQQKFKESKDPFKAANNLYRANFVASIARDVGSMAACPPAAAAASVIVRILETVQEVKNNQDACERLARRCARILTEVNDQMKDKWDSAPRPLIRNLEKFCNTLSAIHHYMQLQAGRKWFKRFLTKGSVEETIQDFDVLLSQASQSFQMSTLIDIHYSIGSTSTKVASDDDQTLCSHDDIVRCGIESIALDVPRVDSPMDETRLVFFQEQPEYDFHTYNKPAKSKVAVDNVHKHFRPMDLATIQTLRRLSTPTDLSWWSDMSVVEVEGQVMVMKQYGNHESKRRRKRWIEDTDLLPTIFHPNFPQLLGAAFNDAEVPFILIEPVVPISTQQAFLDYLPPGSDLQDQAKAWVELALHFFHQLQDVSVYLKETFKVSSAEVLAFLDDASPTVQDGDHLMLGLPSNQSVGLVSIHRNFNIINGLRVACMHMLPTFSEAEAKFDEHTYYSILSGTRQTLWTHFKSDQNLAGLEDEPCDCDDNFIMLVMENERPWVHLEPDLCSAAKVGDLGYLPGPDDEIKNFVKVESWLQDGTSTESVIKLSSRQPELLREDGTDGIEPAVSESNESTCWKITVRPYERMQGTLTTIHRLSDEVGLRHLVESGSSVAEKYGIRVPDLRLVTAVEECLSFDITWLKEQASPEDPSMSAYLHRRSGHAPFLSLRQDDKHGVGASDGFVATLKQSHGQVHLVGLTGVDSD